MSDGVSMVCYGVVSWCCMMSQGVLIYLMVSYDVVS